MSINKFLIYTRSNYNNVVEDYDQALLDFVKTIFKNRDIKHYFVKDLKGDIRPRINLKKRMELMELITSIDDIIPFDEKTPIKMIQKILPNILFKGSDYKQKEVIGYDIIKKNGGTVKIINKLSNFSTTKLIKE